MIARITNFASKENQIIDWEDSLFYVTSNVLEKTDEIYLNMNKEELERLLKQLDLLLQKYPDALKEENILKKSKALIKYAKEKDFTLSNCYSYINEEKRKIDGPWDIKKSTYGIRTLSDRWDNKLVTITGYDSTASGVIYYKNQLNLKFRNRKLDNIKMVHKDVCGVYVFGKETLTYLEPKLLTKHL